MRAHGKGSEGSEKGGGCEKKMGCEKKGGARSTGTPLNTPMSVKLTFCTNTQ